MIYPTPTLETYNVGGHNLTRAAGLDLVKIEYTDKAGRTRRRRSLEATIQPADYPVPDHDRERLVVACGVGTDSIGMLIAMYLRGIRPDVILWADTGSERAHTYRYLVVLQRWLESVGFPPLCIVRRHCPQAGHRSLFEQLWKTCQLPSPAFHQNHSCSISWKLEPQRAYLAQLPWLREYQTSLGFAEGEERRGMVTETVGFAAGEEGRKSYKQTDKDGFRTWYPLMAWGIDRQGCVDLIDQAGLPQPGKSACFFCPMSRFCEVSTMRDTEPGNVAAAVDLEERFENSKNFKNRFAGLSIYGDQLRWGQWEAGDTARDHETFVGLEAAV